MLSLSTLASTAFAPPAASLMAARPIRISMTAEMQPPMTSTPEPEPELPLIKRIAVGSGDLAGDMGFDPLGLADNPESLAWMREAEVKHARLAMLAAFGWPISEVTNFGKLLTSDFRAPSLLNGGLGEVNSLYWAGVVALGVYWESQGLDKQFGKKDASYLPGMLGFDPMGADSQGMRNAEITNGRVAMLAITVFALEEAITKAPIFPISLFTPSIAAIAEPVTKAVGKIADNPLLLTSEIEEISKSLLAAPVEAVTNAAEAVTDAVEPLATAATTLTEPLANAAEAVTNAAEPLATAATTVAEPLASISW